jgi:phosphoserine phosphatase
MILSQEGEVAEKVTSCFEGLPLVVDLDGTLIETDLSLLSSRRYVGWKLWRVLPIFYLLLKGRAILKAFLCKRVLIDVASLPYNDAVLRLIFSEKQKGRPIVLATGSYLTQAKEIADYLGVFDYVFGSHGTINLIGLEKRDLLLTFWGKQGFDYLGNSQSDLPIWAVARYAYLVKPKRGVERKARALGNVVQLID